MFDFLKSKPKPIELSENPSAEQLTKAILSLAPEIEESMSPADIQLAFEDRGWLTNWSNGKSRGALSSIDRKTLIEDSRMYWHRDPLGKQPVRLWSDYAIGTGIIYKDENADKAKTPGQKVPPSETQKSLDKFWKYHKNRCLTSSQGQWELSNQLLIDGDIFFAITEGDVPIIRTIDPLQITHIISDPQDEQTVLCFKREFPGPNNQTKTLYYRNWTAEDSEVASLKDPDDGKSIRVEDDVVIYQHSFEKFGKRGNGLLFCAIDWSRYHRQFMNARVSLTAALAKFAHKLTVKGSDKVVNAVASRLGSSIPKTGIEGLPERNPPTTAGGSFVQNQGLDLQPMPRATGGGDAKLDGDQLKLMVCAATNVHMHYFGDPSTGNLATAEAMELPMLKSFTRYQESWKDAWRDIFSIVLGETIDDEPAAIKIHLPPMLKDDLSRLGQFLMGLHQVFPEIQVPEILEMCLVALGCQNVDETMESIAEKSKELQAAQDALGTQLPQPTLTVSKSKAPPVKGATPAAVKEAFASFAEEIIGRVRLEFQSSQNESVEAMSARAVLRLAEALEKESPILDAATIERLLESKKVSKTAKFSRDTATGELSVAIEETAVAK